MNITKKWKKVLAVGCSHGALVDRTALDAVCRFRDEWKPDTVIHLGDWADTTAFRSGARGTADESTPLDVAIGIEHLERLRCNVVLMGNHEDRLYRAARHHNEVIAECGRQLLDMITKRLHKLKCAVIPYDGNRQAFMLGGVRYMHGTVYSENAVRDHAEMFGATVFAHSHRPGMARGRTFGGQMAYNTGWLGDVAKADYAKARRSTLGWGQGFVWGYYSQNKSQLWLHEKTNGEWILPA